MASTPEGRVKDLIKKWLKERSIPYWMIVPSPMSGKGVSDMVCILPNGQWLAIEAKRPGGKKTVTVHQQKFMDTINNNGGYAFVVDSQEDLDDIDTVLAHLGVML